MRRIVGHQWRHFTRSTGNGASKGAFNVCSARDCSSKAKYDVLDSENPKGTMALCGPHAVNYTVHHIDNLGGWAHLPQTLRSVFKDWRPIVTPAARTPSRTEEDQPVSLRVG